MQVTSNFIFMSRAEFRPWLQGQKITRKITRLQNHHTYIPNHETRRDDTQLETMEAMRSYHRDKMNWREIGQNITTLEDGTIVISRGRGLNDTPAGIAGANTGAICIENVGNFDVADSKAKLDSLTTAQKASIIEVFAALAEKLNLPVDTDHIVYHAWYTASGKWLGDYKAGVSSKPCPGRNWWNGDGNSRAAANKRFLPDIRARLAEMRGIVPTKPPVILPTPPADKPKPTLLEIRHNGLTIKSPEAAGLVFGKDSYAQIALLARILLGTVDPKKTYWNNTEKKAYFNGREIQTAQAHGGRVYLPVKVIAQEYGAQVKWDGSGPIVDIIKEEKS